MVGGSTSAVPDQPPSSSGLRELPVPRDLKGVHTCPTLASGREEAALAGDTILCVSKSKFQVLLGIIQLEMVDHSHCCQCTISTCLAKVLENILYPSFYVGTTSFIVVMSIQI